jgi:hypothetical protein
LEKQLADAIVFGVDSIVLTGFHGNPRCDLRKVDPEGTLDTLEAFVGLGKRPDRLDNVVATVDHLPNVVEREGSSGDGVGRCCGLILGQGRIQERGRAL